MRLICDDFQQIYVWVEDHNEDLELSPHFDYEEDAINWYYRVAKQMIANHNLKSEHNNGES